MIRLGIATTLLDSLPAVSFIRRRRLNLFAFGNNPYRKEDAFPDWTDIDEIDIRYKERFANYNYRHKFNRKDHMKQMSHCLATGIISITFRWTNTIEGYDYWAGVRRISTRRVDINDESSGVKTKLIRIAVFGR